MFGVIIGSLLKAVQRLSHQGLMVEKLSWRKILVDDLCEAYRQYKEDMVHALYRCPLLEPLWRCTPIWNHDALKRSISFTDIIEFFFVGDKDPELFTLVIWNLSNRRNNLRLGKPALPLDKILDVAREKWLETFLVEAPTLPQGPTTWSPLEKITTAGMGIIIRNNEGLPMASLSQKIPLPNTVIEVEILAT
uniref:Reverse transcriptase zinc-binding domain-containing protein n=1 Tax=Quercus lobata TaxID=97700 RepID=A0A7N2MRZ9_QUELO